MPTRRTEALYTELYNFKRHKMSKSKARTSNKRTPLQRECDVMLIIKLLTNCRTQDEMTAELNKAREGRYRLSRVPVRDDIRKPLKLLWPATVTIRFKHGR
jgi:hypothetical protein